MRSKPPNEYRSGGAANSGCYFVPATKAAILAFTNIETHSGASKNSEQPSFYVILCLPPLGSVVGTNCVFKSKVGALQVNFLDRSAYAHGAVFLTPANQNVWNMSYSNGTSSFGSQVALHNNWIVGYLPKIERQKAAGLWYLRMDGSCLI
jgi:hypothetical protein